MQLAPMKEKRRTGFGLVLAGLMSATLIACGSSPTSTTTSTAPASATPGDLTPGTVQEVGYSTGREIGLVSGGKVVATAAATPLRDTISFTSDQHFLFAASRSDAGIQIVAIDTASLQSRSVPVPSSEVYAGPGSSVYWWESPNRLMSVDLSVPDQGPAVARTIEFPPAVYRGQPAASPQLIAAHESDTVFSRMEDGLDHASQRLYLVDAAGKLSTVDVTQGETPVGSAWFSPDGNTIAFFSNPRYCGHGIIGLIDTHAGALKYIDLPNSGDKPERTGVTRLWWAPDGTLMASLSASNCDDPTHRTGPTVWQYDNHHWVQTSAEPAIEKARMSASQVVALIPNASKSNDLVLSDGGKKTTLVPNVQYVVTEPQSR